MSAVEAEKENEADTETIQGSTPTLKTKRVGKLT
jgi:hypothetical protein